MPGSGKDRLAALVVDQHGAFEEALAGSRQRYPTREFRSFARGDTTVCRRHSRGRNATPRCCQGR